MGDFDYGQKANKKEIFHNINLEVAEGEVLCLLGPNGCGKTTLLSCLNGTLKLSDGEASLGGSNIAAMAPDAVARRVGTVFQDHSQAFPFSVLEIVRMGRAPHLGFFSSPSREDTEIALEALEACRHVPPQRQAVHPDEWGRSTTHFHTLALWRSSPK